MTRYKPHKGAVEVRQHYKYDCGAACLASIATHYGIRISLARIRMACGCTPEGISIQGIIDGASRIGLKAKGYKSAEKNIAPLKGHSAPFIAHIKDDDDYYHYIVVYDMTDTRVKAMDPSPGKIVWIPIGEFIGKWTGYIITVAPDTVSGTGEGRQTPISHHLLALFKSFFREIALSFAGSAVCTFAGISITFLLQQLIDNVVPSGNHTAMIALGALTVMLTAFTLYIGWAAAGYLIRCSLKLETSLVSGYMEKILSLPQEFFNNYRAGDISSRRDDIENVRSFITDGAIGILTSVITIAGALSAMLIYNPKLTLYISLFIPLYYGLYWLSGRISRRYSRDIASANAAFESQMLDCISGIGEIRHYGARGLAVRKNGGESGYPYGKDALLCQYPQCF